MNNPSARRLTHLSPRMRRHLALGRAALVLVFVLRILLLLMSAAFWAITAVGLAVSLTSRSRRR